MTPTPETATQRRLIVHMGVQKTGSTSLHHYLQSHEAALETRLQLLTPRRASPTRDMGRAAALFSLDPSAEAGRREHLVETIAAVRASIPDTPGTTVISHENLPGASLGRAGTVTLYPLLEEIVALLDTHLAPLVPEYAIYTREMAAWKRSVYNQAVRSDGYTGDWATFQAETAECGSFEDVAQRLERAAPGRTHVFRLEDEPDPARPGSQILLLAGLEPEEVLALAPHPRRNNQSINAGSIEFLRRVNALDLKPKQRRMIAYLIARNQNLFIDEAAPAEKPAPLRRPA